MLNLSLGCSSVYMQIHAYVGLVIMDYGIQLIVCCLLGKYKVQLRLRLTLGIQIHRKSVFANVSIDTG